MTDHDHDSELVALIDNELEGDTRARLLARLAEDEAMRKRYDALREAGRLMVIALDALLQEAPLPQLRACLGGGKDSHQIITHGKLRWSDASPVGAVADEHPP